MTTEIARPLQATSGRRAQSSGFTMVEALVVVAIGLIVTLIALPLMQNMASYMRMRAAAATVSGAIQNTRYNAIYNGYPYQLTLTKANRTLQVSNLPPLAATFSNVGNAIPFATSPKVQLNQDTVFQFRPSGVVNVISGSNVMTVTCGNRVATITVSGLGNVNVIYQ